MIRRLFPSFLLCLVACRAVWAQLPPEINGAHSENDLSGNTFTFTGPPAVTVDYGGIHLSADKMVYDRRTNYVTATGHAELTYGPRRLVADLINYKTTDGSYTVERFRVGEYPVYVSGTTATGTKDSLILNGAKFSLREPGVFAPTLTADQLFYSPGKAIETNHAHLGVGPALPITLPNFRHEFNEPLLTYATITAGYRSSLGAYLETGLHLPVTPGLHLGGDLDYYSARGFMAGPSGTYSSPTDPESLNGSFSSGFINDHGDKKNDVLGRPVPENRGFVEWTHQQLVTENLTLTAQLNYWKDSEILRDFRPGEFFHVQEPDTYVESVYTGKNYFVSLFARFQPDKFFSVQQRLPEVRFDLMPFALGEGFYQQFNASAAVLSEDPPGGGPALRSDRFDAYYALTRPLRPTDWLTVTPLIGGRLTHYADTEGAARNGGYTRALGEFGFDAELRSSGTFDYKNDRWKIDGLRHLFTPVLSYRYIPEGDRGRPYIPQIDDNANYSTYLPPLGLGTPRNLDDLHALNTLRVGFNNTLQTRDPTYGSRDLLTLNVAADFRFHRDPGDRDVSEIHTELAAMPAPWLKFDVYESFVPQTFLLREFNSGLTIHDGREWSVRLSNSYLRLPPTVIAAEALEGDIKEYAVDGRMRLNEVYEAIGRLQYDAIHHRFVEQSYGLRQNLANSWIVEYAVTLYDGPRRESKFGLRVNLELIKF